MFNYLNYEKAIWGSKEHLAIKQNSDEPNLIGVDINHIICSVLSSCSGEYTYRCTLLSKSFNDVERCNCGVRMDTQETITNNVEQYVTEQKTIVL